MRRLSLRAKLLASFVLILLPFLGLLVYGYREANERRISTILDNQMQTAQAVAVLVDANLDEAQVLATALASDPLVQTLDQARLDPYLERLAPSYPQYEVIGIVNAAGDNVGISSPFPAGTDRRGIAADRPYFQRLMATGQPVVSPVLISRATLRPTMVVGVPIRNAAGAVVGAVLVTPYLEALSAKLQSVVLRPEQHILLLDPTGTVAFHSGAPELAWQERNLSDFEPVKAALEGRSTELRRYVSPILGDTRVGAFTPSPKYGWVVGVGMAENVALAPVRVALRDQLLGFGAIAILSLGLVLLASNAFLQPIRRLTSHATALGKGDLSQRVEVKTGDELERLGDTFNQMAERLGRTLGDLLAVLDATENGILMYDRELFVRLANRRMSEWFALEPRQVVGQPVDVVAHEAIAPTLADPKRLLACIDWLSNHPEETITEEVEVVKPERRILRLYFGPVRADGERIGYINVYTDITALRRREEERQALGQVAGALVRELTLEGVADVVVEQGQRVLLGNAVALFLADPERGQLRLLAQRGLSARTVAELSSLLNSAPFATALAARTGEPQEVPDVLAAGPELSGGRRVAKREGQRSILAQPLFAKGRLVGVLTLAKPEPHRFAQWERELIRAFADLCAAAVENARLYEDLRETLHLREEFISAAAHELKTPVTTIKGYVQAMRKWAPEGHEPREAVALDVLNRQCDRINRRVQEMLESVRLRRVPPEQARTRFDLGDLAAEVVHRVQTTTQLQTLVLKREARVPVEADRERIEEVLVSLLDNAIKFSPEGGHIEVRVFTREREAIVAVRDYGTGIAKERQAHIFEPFYEQAPPGAPGYHGVTALSLYLSKLTVELHKGRIWFESEEGEGSTFYFSLPLAEPAART